MERHASLVLAGVLVASVLLGQEAAASEAGMTLVERATTDTVSVHGGKTADDVGDILTFANPVYDAADRMMVGSDQGYCVRLVVGHAFECHWTLLLPKGQIVVDGPFYDTADSTMAITGGTGIYSRVRGEMQLHARDPKGKEFDFRYTFE